VNRNPICLDTPVVEYEVDPLSVAEGSQLAELGCPPKEATRDRSRNCICSESQQVEVWFSPKLSSLSVAKEASERHLAAHLKKQRNYQNSSG